MDDTPRVDRSMHAIAILVADRPAKAFDPCLRPNPRFDLDRPIEVPPARLRSPLTEQQPTTQQMGLDECILAQCRDAHVGLIASSSLNHRLEGRIHPLEGAGAIPRHVVDDRPVHVDLRQALGSGISTHGLLERTRGVPDLPQPKLSLRIEQQGVVRPVGVGSLAHGRPGLPYDVLVGDEGRFGLP